MVMKTDKTKCKIQNYSLFSLLQLKNCVLHNTIRKYFILTVLCTTSAGSSHGYTITFVVRRIMIWPYLKCLYHGLGVCISRKFRVF
jgi:hypothetical protein